MFFTDRQLKVLGFVNSYTRTNGVAPTLKEIAEQFGVTKVTALEHLRALEKKNAIRRSRHQPRSIEIVSTAPVGEPLTTIPLTGELREDQRIAYDSRPFDLDLKSLLPRAKNGHGLRVVGDHLASMGFVDGDLLIIEPTAVPIPGRIVLISISRDRALIGRFGDTPFPHIVRSALGSESRTAVDLTGMRGIVRALIRRLPNTIDSDPEVPSTDFQSRP